MDKIEIEEGFKLLGLDDKLNETYENVSEFAQKLTNPNKNTIKIWNTTNSSSEENKDA